MDLNEEFFMEDEKLKELCKIEMKKLDNKIKKMEHALIMVVRFIPESDFPGIIKEVREALSD